MVERDIFLAVDLGGTNCRVGVVINSGLIESETVPTPQDSDELFRSLGNQLLHFSSKYDVGVGVMGVPGKVELTGGDYVVRPLPNISGIDEAFDLNERIKAENPGLGVNLLPVNDAVAQTHTVAREHAVDRNEQPLVFLTLSTGVGGAVSQGYNVHPREYGHMPIFGNNEHLQRLEQRVSGTAISKLYGGQGTTSVEVLYDKATDSIWRSVGRDIGYGIGVIVPVESMSQVVIGGGVGANCNSRFSAALNERLDEVMATMPADVFTRPDVSFMPPEEDPTIGMRGCYYAAVQNLDYFA